ncbi:Phosphoenolpyruvate/pyruvate domain-containing protein [Acaromyces ingoldii]|uniref:Phosphoenolpyruvate/pyruvate domain-containing protein n=1 Tax=Acaromyces ingoldii TaxID=215250 RepID=A0A316YE46_9BASI|nr:Phosphoenolpyruvate/pyruvate domain-containing protein [Acaromyces ingoldii]PWN87860.1 Phosphoenolpyruvate/pyruvate domain-containing protein [Acaromyces ingoldii]
MRTGAAELRLRIRNGELVVAPGVFDGISIRMALKTGHKALYVTGAGTSASFLGRADLGFLSARDVVHVGSLASQLAGPQVPVICDADTGFGGAPQVARTVQEYWRAGIAALHIEDQVATKRCGHLDSKQLVGQDDFIARIKAASHARDQLCNADVQDRIVVIARTDALAGLGLDEAVSRLKMARDAGADVGFLEGMTTDAEVHRARSLLKDWPLLANCVTGGKSPLWTASDCKELGFSIAIFPTAGLFPAARALQHSYAHLLSTGIGAEAATDESRSVDVGGADPRGLRNFFVDMGLEDEVALDRLAADGTGLGAV